jgi:hypothetical protein
MLDMREVQNIIVCNTTLEQYTCYNFPLIETDMLKKSHLKSLTEFEKLHDRYLTCSSKKDILLKKVYAIDTYVLYSLNDYIVFATIS